MVEQEISIINKLGLHARAAAKFVTLAAQFESHIQVGRGERMVNGKSIMGVMMLAVGKGTEIEIIAHGSDANKALDTLESMILDRFGEDE